jgi:thiamine biosynthesis protein ThiI
MFKIAQKIAQKENCKALVTGESLGQVSSQTLPNLEIISEGIKIPILRPLIGFNKEEIIKIAKKIGTFEISILPQEDCCSLFVPKHATAKGNLEKIKKLEKKIDLNKIIKETIKGTEVVQY